MGSSKLLSPPRGDGKAALSRKSTSSSSFKSVKPAARRVKRRIPSISAPICDYEQNETKQGAGTDGRQPRVWRACEHCRMKKTKCDGELPCKRCKDSGVICTASLTKKTGCKQVPKGYAEVLENTQLALIATVRKLYSLIRSGQQWEVGEPELNECGQPVIHSIVQLLGCTRRGDDVDLPVRSVFPEDEAGLAELAHQISQLQQPQHAGPGSATEHSSPIYKTELFSSSSQHHHPDAAREYGRAAAAFDSESGLTPSPRTSVNITGVDFGASTALDTDAMFSSPQPLMAVPNVAYWDLPEVSPSDMTMQLLLEGVFQKMDIFHHIASDPGIGTVKHDMPLHHDCDFFMSESLELN